MNLSKISIAIVWLSLLGYQPILSQVSERFRKQLGHKERRERLISFLEDYENYIGVNSPSQAEFESLFDSYIQVPLDFKLQNNQNINDAKKKVEPGIYFTDFKQNCKKCKTKLNLDPPESIIYQKKSDTENEAYVITVVKNISGKINTSLILKFWISVKRRTSEYKLQVTKLELISEYIPPTRPPSVDTDDDGFDQKPKDKCPDLAGPVKGCPDDDGDKIANFEDNCPFEAGITYQDSFYKDYLGCPDTNNNLIPDKYEEANKGVDIGINQAGRLEGSGGGIEDEKVVPPPPDNAFYKEDGTINIPEVISDSKKLEELIDTINAYENRKQLDEFDFQAYKDYGKAIFTAINQDRKDKGMPTLETSNETALIPGGAFIFGDAKNKNKSISLEVSEFLAVTKLITNEDYANFLNSYQGQYKPKSKEFKSRKDSGQAGNKLMLRLNPTYFDVKEIQEDSFVVIAKKGTAEEPITQVTWFGAYEFARHYGLWLPTEVQWEYLSKTYKEDEVRFPVGYSEWCQDKYSKGAIKDWKSKKKTQRDPEYPGDIDDRKVLRSSAYKARNFSLPESTDTNISFRCVVRTNTIGQ